MFSCSLPYSMHSNPLPNALFWAICLKSWWQADLMETLKWLSLGPHSVISSDWCTKPDPVMWNKQSDQSAEPPLCLSARNHAAGTEPQPGRQCVQAQLFVQRGNCAEGSLSAGLVLLSAPEGASCRPQPWTPSKEFSLSDTMGLPICNTLERRLVLMEVLV